MPAPQASNDLGIGLDELFRVLRRRKAWLLVPSLLGMALALALALGLPPVYESASIVVVEPQEIPDTLVESTVVAATEARYNHLMLQILSRDNLSSVIDQFKLYAGEVAPREELVLKMREEISIEPLPPAIVDPRKPVKLESFRIAFRSPRRVVVADVTNRLTRDFISKYLEDRNKQARGAQQFVNTELAKAQHELEQTQREITAYQEEHQGELPDELLLNTQRLERLRTQLGETGTNIRISKDQVHRIEADIVELQSSMRSDQNDPEQRKEALELLVNQHLAQGKTEKHPDVVQARAEIVKLEKMIANRGDEDRPRLSPAIASLQRELRNHRVNIDVMSKEIGGLQGQISKVELQIANTPKRTADLGLLESRARNLEAAIRGLQGKAVDASMGVAIETDQKGEKFQVVEWATPPDNPVSPNRPLWFLIGSMLGVLFGMGLLIVREMTDATFHTAAELERVTALPVLASVPEIRLPAERAGRRSRIRRIALSSALVLLLIFAGTFAYYIYVHSGSGPHELQRMLQSIVGGRFGHV